MPLCQLIVHPCHDLEVVGRVGLACTAAPTKVIVVSCEGPCTLSPTLLHTPVDAIISL